MIKEIKTLIDLQKEIYIEYKINGYEKMWNMPKDKGLSLQTQKIFDIAELGLIDTEVSEAIEELRKQKTNRELLATECVDIIIRTLNFMTRNKLDLEIALYRKMNKNLGRLILHGKDV